MKVRLAAVVRRIRETWPKAVARVPVGQQLAGAALAAAGVWLQFGMPVAFMVGGAGLAAVGALKEGGRI